MSDMDETNSGDDSPLFTPTLTYEPRAALLTGSNEATSQTQVPTNNNRKRTMKSRKPQQNINSKIAGTLQKLTNTKNPNSQNSNETDELATKKNEIKGKLFGMKQQHQKLKSEFNNQSNDLEENNKKLHLAALAAQDAKAAEAARLKKKAEKDARRREFEENEKLEVLKGKIEQMDNFAKAAELANKTLENDISKLQEQQKSVLDEIGKYKADIERSDANWHSSDECESSSDELFDVDESSDDELMQGMREMFSIPSSFSFKTSPAVLKAALLSAITSGSYNSAERALKAISQSVNRGEWIILDNDTLQFSPSNDNKQKVVTEALLSAMSAVLPPSDVILKDYIAYINWDILSPDTFPIMLKPDYMIDQLNKPKWTNGGIRYIIDLSKSYAQYIQRLVGENTESTLLTGAQNSNVLGDIQDWAKSVASAKLSRDNIEMGRQERKRQLSVSSSDLLVDTQEGQKYKRNFEVSDTENMSDSENKYDSLDEEGINGGAQPSQPFD